jgi:hypothetical protein
LIFCGGIWANLSRRCIRSCAKSSPASPKNPPSRRRRRLTSRQQQLLASLREAPVLALAQSVWYQAKALEVAAEFFFVAPGEQELFCQRQQRLSAERVEKVIALLREKLAEPPTLEESGARPVAARFI